MLSASAATRGLPPAYAKWRARDPVDYGPGSGPAQILAGVRVIHIADAAATESYRNGEPNRRALVDLGGARSFVTVPLLKHDEVLGMIMIYRQDFLTEAGLPTDRRLLPKTWDQFRDLMKKLVRADGTRLTRAGFDVPRNDEYLFLTIWRTLEDIAAFEHSRDEWRARDLMSPHLTAVPQIEVFQIHNLPVTPPEADAAAATPAPAEPVAQ